MSTHSIQNSPTPSKSDLQKSKLSLKRELPAYLEYASDILANINYRCMSLQERGLWDTMRKECWVNYWVPSNKNDLSKILHISLHDLESCLTERVLFFFCLEGDKYYSPELNDYREKTLINRELQSKGGAEGGLKTQKANREAKAKLQGEVKVLNRDEEIRDEIKRRELSRTEIEEDIQEWIEDYDRSKPDA
jgi:hypothetical protein